MKVLKFGGTSVGSVENLLKVKKIVESQNDDVVVIVSALGGITDKILAMARTASTTGTFNETEMMDVHTRHFATIESLMAPTTALAVKQSVQKLLDELANFLKGISLLREITPKTLDRVAGMGELLSSTIIAPFLDAKWFDSRELIRTDSNFVKAEVDFATSNKLLTEAFSGFSGRAVAPGFIASNDKGEPTTLGRGGSDYTAAIYAAALDASVLEIWTDVDGFMTADPRIIRKAYTIDYLTYSEAMELSHFGAKVIYPPTILPVLQKKIPVWIKNTTKPDEPGTLIGYEKRYGKERIIKGISSISDISLITLQGAGMVGVTGISMRLFAALARKRINVILISQASSENSISIAVHASVAKEAAEEVAKEFEHEITIGHINGVKVEDDLSIVAIVGENMRESAGIAGKLFHTIGKNGVNVRAIAQGASELNISWVIKTSDLRKTLNVVHESFFLSSYKELNLFLMGIGTVGGNFLEQLLKQQQKLFEEKRLKLKLVGVANSKRMLFNRDGIDLENYFELLNQSALLSVFSSFVEHMTDMNMFNSVFIDCTASEEVTNFYLPILESNISIVAANKVAASSSYSNYRLLKKTALSKGVRFLYETNVGAGLPVLSTINDLTNSGDRILKIEAVLSGTLNFIFNTMSSDVSLSEAIKRALAYGYSEPDPRIDLSGKDVVRKLLILAREAGYEIDEEQVNVSGFIPDALFERSLDDFWMGIKQLDADFEEKRAKVQSENKCWRYIARFDRGQAHVALEAVNTDSPFYHLEGSNNIILLTTERYNEFPMLIKGYGAGAGVTAAGVFADIMRIANI
ncbi:MAG TPA: bifunctional aspartate kinase/homoserine dehydrogenase I [Prolixibacteraceae bacterium]|nr:bifunctional aspartate kinase/homoserine dehydrogenase I [Prolixibacteraceae bacterium]